MGVIGSCDFLVQEFLPTLILENYDKTVLKSTFLFLLVTEEHAAMCFASYFISLVFYLYLLTQYYIVKTQHAHQIQMFPDVFFLFFI